MNTRGLSLALTLALVLANPAKAQHPEIGNPAAGSSGQLADPPRYIVSDLGTFGGEWSYPSAINSSGEVVGFSTGGGGFLFLENIIVPQLGQIALRYFFGKQYFDGLSDLPATSKYFLVCPFFYGVGFTGDKAVVDVGISFF